MPTGPAEDTRDVIEREDHDGVTLLRLAHGRVNALDFELTGAIAGVFGELADDPRAIVLTGAGSSFCAGVDLKRIVDGGEDHGRRFLAALSRAFLVIFDHPGPTVAAVNGHAIAGGLVIALACDHRIAADGKARLGLSELAVGVPFPTSAIEIVRHALGPAVARDLALTARLVGAEEAAGSGVVDRVVPAEEVVTEALALARRVGGYAPAAYALAKQQLQRPARAAIAAHAEADGPRSWGSGRTGPRSSASARSSPGSEAYSGRWGRTAATRCTRAGRGSSTSS